MKCIKRKLGPLALALLAGCGASGSPPGTATVPAASPSPVATSSRFDPATAGSVHGQVLWHGDIPKVPLITAALPDGAGNYRPAEMPNPFAPVVEPRSRGLAGAVVFLKGVDPALGKPWDLPPVRVEQRDFRIRILQGDEPRAVGFVHRGDEVEMVSADPAHHMLRARGAAYFTLPFPDPDKPLRRRFDTPGLVELTSGAGYFWAAADLFVDDHPYYALTDREGRFTLRDVPPGKYELVCWVRDWHVTGRDRDPETGLVFRQQYAAPVEKRAAVELPAKGTVERSFALGSGESRANPER